MVQLQRSNGGCFWIDKTEVSNADYKAFLDAEKSKAGQQPAPCDWNTSYEPSCPGAAGAGGTGVADDQLPVVCVDQCDAQAFCAWDGGKRLCATSAFKSDTNNEWLLACAGDGLRSYSYGNSADSQLCNGSDGAGKGSPLDVGALSGCATPQGVLDLSGNVSEWLDDCQPTKNQDDECVYRGGSYKISAVSDKCDKLVTQTRDHAAPDLGFRCCAGATP
jgi:formylglycine-generating enzyme required for sulfatase activity